MDKKITSYIVTFLLILFLVAFIFLPKKEFSESENRFLTKMPRFTLNSFLSGELFLSLDEYISDHFVFRDSLIGLKSMTEKTIGKHENNGVFITNNQLFSKLDPPNMNIVNGNINAVIEFSKNNNVQPFMSIVSNASEIQQESLPNFAVATVFNQSDFLNDVFKSLEGNVEEIDINNALIENSSEDVFYKTDHHWTSKGAYLAYIETGKYFNYNGFNLDLFSIKNVNNEFYGSLYSKSAFHNINKDTIKQYTTMQFYESDYKFYDNSSLEKIELDSMFFEDALEKKDKYLYFTGENRAISTVITNLENEKRILIFKDSFANAYLPFLVPHFHEITMIDLRYVSDTYLDKINISDYDYIYILYSLETFITSNDLLKIGG